MRGKRASLALVGVFLALVGAEEELSIEKLDSNHSEDEVEQEVHDQDVEHVLERVDDAVEDRLQLRDSLDGLEGSEHTKYSERLHGAQVLTS